MGDIFSSASMMLTQEEMDLNRSLVQELEALL